MDDVERIVSKYRDGKGWGGIIGESAGVITVRPRPLIPFGQFSTLQNVRRWYPGLEKRRGTEKFHSVTLEPPLELTFDLCASGFMQCFGTTFANARNGISDQFPFDSSLDVFNQFSCGTDYSASSGGTWTVRRLFYHFDISAIPVGSTISGGTFTLQPHQTGPPANESCQVFGGTLTPFACPSGPYINAHFSQLTASAIAPQQAGGIFTLGVGVPQVLNAAGVTYLQGQIASGLAHMVVREFDHDVSNVDQAPDTTNYNATWTLRTWPVPAQRATLTVSYFPP